LNQKLRSSGAFFMLEPAVLVYRPTDCLALIDILNDHAQAIEQNDIPLLLVL
jgi:hypothetical protein